MHNTTKSHFQLTMHDTRRKEQPIQKNSPTKQALIPFSPNELGQSSEILGFSNSCAETSESPEIESGVAKFEARARRWGQQRRQLQAVSLA
ncbi:hypothetical protein TIFTF001_019486 [Ficus carica]|uniref:Uncharacterized protein n=1 Tax=Ficus carica TaxID=3494 RepID=A0AA88AGH6_FICCA|nr:hypothetical protein TIFTF001_019486 [Ficus carica]